MSTGTLHSIIPEQEEGAQSNTESSIELQDEETARAFYKTVCDRLRDVNHWHEYAGKGTAEFRLIDAEGNNVSRTAGKGDFFQIDIPGPGTEAGQGNDWVRIEDIDEVSEPAAQATFIRVRPSDSPLSGNTQTAHFLHTEATSTFVVQRERCTVTAGVYGRNEKPNTDSGGVIDKIRNAVVALGAMAGLSKAQWKSLVEGWIKKDA